MQGIKSSMSLNHCDNFVLKQVKTDRIYSNQLERILSLNLLILNSKRETRPGIKELYVFHQIKLVISGSEVRSLHGPLGISWVCGSSCKPFSIDKSEGVSRGSVRLSFLIGTAILSL